MAAGEDMREQLTLCSACFGVCRWCRVGGVWLEACSSLVFLPSVFPSYPSDQIVVFLGLCLQNWTRSATTARAEITEGWRAPRSPADSAWRGTRTCCMTSCMWAPWTARRAVASGITPSAGASAFGGLLMSQPEKPDLGYAGRRRRCVVTHL